MLRVHQLVLSLEDAAGLDEALLIALCERRLRVLPGQILSAKVAKRSVDARDKGDVHFSLTVDVALAGGRRAEKALAAKAKPNEMGLLEPPEASLWPERAANKSQDPKGVLVVGAGPAGLLCAYALARRGMSPILIDRGQAVESRALAIDAFETKALLDSESNVLFGEGGAGTFSDGKLTCGLNHPHIAGILQLLVDCGAPEEILISQRPHIGTDQLRRVLVGLRQKLVDMGVDIRFGHRLERLVLQDGTVAQALICHQGQEESIPVRAVFLAIGHSARDTYAMLHAAQIPMEAKPFAVGLRIEHLQQEINKAQYGKSWQHPALPPAEYKLNIPTPDGRGVYTFCMCPGGRVIGAMNEPGTVNVNGMSLHARDGQNANAALLVGVRPSDFGNDHPLAGVAFQRNIEAAAFALAGAAEAYRTPCQRVEDFLCKRPTKGLEQQLQPSYRPGVLLGEVDPILPGFVADNLRYALPRLGQRLRGFDSPDALLSAPETRSSAPVRILRDKARQSPVKGLFPIGEGAGYAGGIISAALDGLLAGMEGTQ